LTFDHRAARSFLPAGDHAEPARRRVCLHADAVCAHDVDYVRGLGADDSFDFRAERFENKVKTVDAVIDLVGGEILQRSF
jgi:NADPH:quinone reductase-like Zn-dependent oxidoreductase